MALAHETFATPPQHLKITGYGRSHGFSRCEDPGCVVGRDGLGSSCSRLACPSCGCSGTNLSTLQLVNASGGVRVRCSCGHSWVQGVSPVYVLTRAETVECTCPDICERDHANE